MIKSYSPLNVNIFLTPLRIFWINFLCCWKRLASPGTYRKIYSQNIPIFYFIFLKFFCWDIYTKNNRKIPRFLRKAGYFRSIFFHMSLSQNITGIYGSFGTFQVNYFVYVPKHQTQAFLQKHIIDFVKLYIKTASTNKFSHQRILCDSFCWKGKEVI